jgi:penicillin-binding protein 2
LTFAPRNNPKIAMAVYIEYGGSGASIAAPIASLIEEMYLTDTVVRHDLVRMVKSRKIDYSKYYKAKKE